MFFAQPSVSIGKEWSRLSRAESMISDSLDFIGHLAKCMSTIAISFTGGTFGRELRIHVVTNENIFPSENASKLIPCMSNSD
jgi:hypothetical protein